MDSLTSEDPIFHFRAIMAFYPGNVLLEEPEIQTSAGPIRRESIDDIGYFYSIPVGGNYGDSFRIKVNSSEQGKPYAPFSEKVLSGRIGENRLIFDE